MSVADERLYKGKGPEDLDNRDLDIWIQDKMFFTENKGASRVVATQGMFRMSHTLSREFMKNGIEVSDETLRTEGGNFFVGKKENGEKYVLAGEKSYQDAHKIAEIENIKPENIHIIPQGAYHIDVITRPIGFPYILVHDRDLSFENIDKLETSDDIKENLKRMIKSNGEKIKERISGKELAKILKSQGFKPILIGGIYGYDVNFINAIVHKRNNGDLVYITNGTNDLGKEKNELQKMFEEDLRNKLKEIAKNNPEAHVPNIAQIDFILGKKGENSKINPLADFLLGCRAGVHCMSVEEPDFERWA